MNLQPTPSVSLVDELYSPAMEVARKEFAQNPVLHRILDPNLDPAILELFLIYFHTLGVGMTEKVFSWIDQAGRRCEEQGFVEMGQLLRKHARHEAGHHHMMIADTRKLVSHWNTRHSLKLDIDHFLKHPLTPGVRQYRKVNEDCVNGDKPFAQIAVEYEIGHLSIGYGPLVMGRYVSALDPEVLKSLTFLKEHIEVDVDHTQFNESQIEVVLSQHPEFAPAMVAAGASVLAAYAHYLSDCLELAEAQLVAA
jgi:hypothetical protein